MAIRHDDSFDVAVLEQLGVPIKQLVSDSRLIKKGDTFVAYAGAEHDAREYIPQAIAAGANAVLWDNSDFTWNPAWKLPALPIEDLKEKSGLIASHVYGYPSQKLRVVGITGTNGKTSCSHWFAQAMRYLGKKTAVIGTMGNGFDGALEATANTTPDAVKLQQLLASYALEGAENVVMEVSSHGIEQGRVIGTLFSAAVLTNLSRDHLDYHHDMDNYAAAKAKLFLHSEVQCAVLNLDDAFGVKLSQQLVDQPVQVIGYGFNKRALLPAKHCNTLIGSNLQASISGLAFDVAFEGHKETLKTSLIGRFNAENLLAVMAALLANGVHLSEAVQALQHVRPIPGRMEKFGGINQSLVIVDYAHTPDALREVLETLREIMEETTLDEHAEKRRVRLFCVVGCGGGRDRGKRALIGEIATRYADEVIFTSDNPREEEPAAIIQDMIAGAVEQNYQIQENRELAIYQAIYGARKGSIVLLAGKGHEQYQEINGKKIPFSDAETVRHVLRELAFKAQGQL